MTKRLANDLNRAQRDNKKKKRREGKGEYVRGWDIYKHSKESIERIASKRDGGMMI